MKYIIDIKGEIEGDYEIIGKYEERPMNERKKGKWIVGGIEEEESHLGSRWYECNSCHTPGDRQDNFCRGCGADMRGEQDE